MFLLIPLNGYIHLIFFLFCILYFSYHEKPVPCEKLSLEVLNASQILSLGYELATPEIKHFRVMVFCANRVNLVIPYKLLRYFV
jgi:hypothetical protein